MSTADAGLAATQVPTGARIIEIVETSVLGIRAYHARCRSCGERCHQQAHDRERTAVRCAQRHECPDLYGGAA